MKNAPSDRAKRVLISFWVPDYVYENAKKRAGEGNVNALCKIFFHQFAAGNGGIEVIFDKRIANQSKKEA